jgi:plastocyanin
MGMDRLPVAAVGIAALLALSACSSSSSSGGSSTSAAISQTHASSPAGGGAAASTSAGSTVTSTAPKITIKNFGYTGTMTVKPGAKVTVVNEDSTAHTLTDKKNHKFDTGNINGNGATGTFTAPTTPGSYPFGCTHHPNMAGTLVVTA